MMTPVGRLIMVRSIDKRQLLNAMSLVTVPALIGPICGPPLGGFITTYASWHWIFLINVPIGLVGIVAAIALYSQRARRASPPVRLLRLRSVRPRHRRACLRAFGDGARLSACERRRRAARRRRHCHDCLCVPRQAHAGADPRSQPAQAADVSRQHRRRLFVPARRRRAAVPAAAVAADRLRPDAVSIRADHVHQRARLDVHEGRRRQRAQAAAAIATCCSTTA